MWVFLDDSGDCGMKFDRGSSSHVVMAACVFRTRGAVEHALECVEAGRLNRAPDGQVYRLGREFKYSSSKDVHKTAFFAAIKGADFAVRVIIIDKRNLWSRRLQENANHLKAEAIYQLLTHTGGTVTGAKLVIDGQDTRAFGVSDRQHFLTRVNAASPNTLQEVEFTDSKRSGLIQLADMVAGAVRRRADDPTDKRAEEHFQSMYPRMWRRNGGSYWPFR